MGRLPENNDSLGNLGELLAEKFLQSKGYEILKKNFRCRLGEIDLVAKESGELVLVEVKCRRGTAFGFPQEQITWKKQKKLSQLAQWLLKRYPADKVIRIDLVAILLDKRRNVLSIDLLQNAVSLF